MDDILPRCVLMRASRLSASKGEFRQSRRAFQLRSRTRPILFTPGRGFVARNPQGERPEICLPLPNQFELIVNLTTARLLGLERPPFDHRRARRVIDDALDAAGDPPPRRRS